MTLSRDLDAYVSPFSFDARCHELLSVVVTLIFGVCSVTLALVDLRVILHDFAAVGIVEFRVFCLDSLERKAKLLSDASSNCLTHHGNFAFRRRSAKVQHLCIVGAGALIRTVINSEGAHQESIERPNLCLFNICLPFGTTAFDLEGAERTADIVDFGRDPPPAFLRMVEMRVVMALFGASNDRTRQKARKGSSQGLSGLPNAAAIFP